MPFEEDPWATKEFYVKWKRWSYIHCSWDTRETLGQLGGYKRVMNYMKRQVPLLPLLPCLQDHKHSAICSSLLYSASCSVTVQELPDHACMRGAFET